MNTPLANSPDYRAWLTDIKEHLRQSQQMAVRQVNSELLRFYWYLGSEIARLQETAVWGTGFLRQLSKDLTDEFKGVEGFSERNLQYIKRFYERYHTIIPQQAIAELANDTAGAELSIPQQPVAELPPLLLSIPWGHHTVILSKAKEPEQARFYMQQTVRDNWSRAILQHQIEADLYNRQGKASTNFSLTLPAKDSDLAREMLKDPYNFDFITVGSEAKERDLEQALVKEVTRLLLELGEGFCYVGRQRMLEVEGDVFFPDLLFFNYISNRFFVFELKAGKFKPEHLGQLGFYAQLINEKLKTAAHQETIGILLCRDANNKVAQIALNGYKTPLGVASYKLIEQLPEEIKGQLPSIEEMEIALEEEMAAFSKRANA